VLVSILKVTIVATILAWVRRRWKWLGACVAAILAVVYLHAEFLDYVAALPTGSDQAATAGRYIPLSFVLKNTVILGSLLAYLLFEMRTWRRRKTNRRGLAENSSSRTAVESTSGGASASDADNADDGFDFLRHGRKLENRAQKVIKRKPAR
jgi:hypothetical protein